MLFYLLYLAGYVGCWVLPRRVCYWVACWGADYSSWRARKDREAVRANLAAVLGTQEIPPGLVRDVFRNFAKYLVDFLRFDRLNLKTLNRRVKIEGLENMKAALSQGKGAVGLTAHLGNYELAGAVLGLLGLPIHAVVLTHQNSHVNQFFTRQRLAVGVQGIQVLEMTHRAFFEKCLAVLRSNQILALVGDRDFFGYGLELPFFGKKTRIPRGPAALSLKTGAPIVPSFLVREKDGSYRFILEPPIVVPDGLSHEEAVRKLTEQCLEAMVRTIRQYPAQWYMFQEFWKPVPPVIL